ncbi:MAG: hypothetical protein HY553_15355 [Elusimicrobia bacterium]|nr:hypothetical protein [Elusimicrobiota bacterium]
MTAACALALAAGLGALRAEEAPIAALELPFAAKGFDARLGPDGALHVAFLDEGRAFYARRASGETAFGKPARIAVKGPRARAPRLAAGPRGRLHVVWDGDHGPVYASSGDGGRSWRSARVRDASGGSIEMSAVAAAPDGTVHVVWVDDRDGHPADDRYASDLYLASSSDGLRFGPNVRLTKDAPRACPCCQPALAVDPRGRLWVAYRSSESNHKDTQVLRVQGARIESTRLSRQRWRFEGCPMDGPSLAIHGSDAAVAWTSDGSVYLAVSRDSGDTFSEPERLGLGKFHSAAGGPSGVVIAWDEGRATGWRRLGQPSGPRLPLEPRGRLLPDGEGFRLVTTRKR